LVELLKPNQIKQDLEIFYCALPFALRHLKPKDSNLLPDILDLVWHALATEPADYWSLCHCRRYKNNDSQYSYPTSKTNTGLTFSAMYFLSLSSESIRRKLSSEGS
jgi:hypothetical protein